LQPILPAAFLVFQIKVGLGGFTGFTSRISSPLMNYTFPVNLSSLKAMPVPPGVKE